MMLVAVLGPYSTAFGDSSLGLNLGRRHRLWVEGLDKKGLNSYTPYST